MNHSVPVVGKSRQYAVRPLSVSSQSVPMPSDTEMELQSSPGWIVYVVPAHVGVLGVIAVGLMWVMDRVRMTRGRWVE